MKIKMYRIIILPVVLCGCEIWSLILREDCRLRVFENMVLRRIFGPKNHEVKGDWRRLRNKELYAVLLIKYHSGNRIRKTEVGRTCSTYEARRGAYRVLVGIALMDFRIS
jgi:hypothetical protein